MSIGIGAPSLDTTYHLPGKVSLHTSIQDVQFQFLYT